MALSAEVKLALLNHTFISKQQILPML